MRRQILSDYDTPIGFRGASIVKVQLWRFVKVLFHCSPRFANSWRCFLLRCFGAKIGKKVLIRPSANIEYPWKVTIGSYSWIGEDVNIYSLGNIAIGSNSVISQKTYLCSGSHDYMSESFDIFSKDVVIGDECWLATDVYVAPGISIASGSVVGARSSVFKNIEQAGIYAGSPAKLIKTF